MFRRNVTEISKRFIQRANSWIFNFQTYFVSKVESFPYPRFLVPVTVQIQTEVHLIRHRL